MRTWIVVAAVVFAAGCQAKAPELTPAERFNAESEALERLESKQASFVELELKAKMGTATDETVKFLKENKSYGEQLKDTIIKQRQRVRDAQAALSSN